MTSSAGLVISPLVSTTLGKLEVCLFKGVDAALVGPPGSGLSAIRQLTMMQLKDRGLPVISIDCRTVTPWQEAQRQACQKADIIMAKTGRFAVLLVDHCSDLVPDDIKNLGRAIRTEGTRKFHACLWIGNLDFHSREIADGLPTIRDARSLILMSDYHRDDLLSIYLAIGRKLGCEWGEAILYFLYDWCGPDLALVESIAAYFYGDWRDRLYDESVQECLDRWINIDALVETYRRALDQLQGRRLDYMRLLCAGGKVPCHAPAIEHETDSALCDLFFSGLVAPNLIPGFYQFRNLTVKLLAMQKEIGHGIDSASLLRRSSNARISEVLQDTELSLRHLLTRCFTVMGASAVQRKLETTKTDEQPIIAQLRKSLLGWAQEAGGEEQRQNLTKHMSEFMKEFQGTHNLWTRVCGLYGSEIGSSRCSAPPLENIVDYLNFNELASLVLGLCPDVFPNWRNETSGRQSPARSWPVFLARLRRLRNQSAHLRNVTFQDMEDLLITAKEMRRDIKEYV